MDHHSLYLILATTFGLIMAWGVGANDVANAMGTSVGSKAISIRQALVIATIFEFAGAFLAGGQVTNTLSKGIIAPELLSQSPEILIFGMLAALFAAGIWLFVATHFGWPVSTTHTIVGAILGFGAAELGFQALNWHLVLSIFASWIISPLMGGVLAYVLFMSIQRLILNTDEPFENAKRVSPFYIFIASSIISLVTLLQGLKHIGLNFSLTTNLCIALSLSLGISIVGKLLLDRVKVRPGKNMRLQFASVERLFAILMVFTACAMAFAHGSNDVANAIGPLATIASIVKNDGQIVSNAPIPAWILFLGGAGIVLGLVTYGHKVIATIGQGITELTPTRGFAATTAAACTVVIASGTGLPISTTHTLVGAILGIGLARGIGALNLNVIRNIMMSWVITLPAGALLSIATFYVLKHSIH